MSTNKYTKKQIAWAIAEIKKKRPESKPTEAQAIKLLDTFAKFQGMVTEKIGKDTKKSKIDKLN